MKTIFLKFVSLAILLTFSYFGNAQDLIEINNNKFIPFVDEFVLKVDIDNKKIIIKELAGLL